MNTFRIYEDFRAALGDAAAKSLAQTLGAMFEELRDTVTKEDFRILRESIDANVSRLDGAITRLAEAQSRTEVKVGELAEGQSRLAAAQARTEERINELAQAQARTEVKIGELAEGQSRLAAAQARTEERIDELAQAQARTEVRMNELAQAQARTEVRMDELAHAQARTEVRMNELAQAQARTEERMNELAQAQARTEERMNELAHAQARTEEQVRTLAEVTQRLSNRTDDIVGRTFELQFRDRLTAYLGRFLRRGKVVGNDTLLDAIEPHVTTQEIDDFLRADIVAKGLVDGMETFVVVEVSSTADTKDIVRAERRSVILRKAGLAAIPLVACDAIPPESVQFAHRSGVRVWCNGSLVDAAA
jgi:myosin heavy subunit